jgi:eukaryotic-like serine/threonine-protein kinase
VALQLHDRLLAERYRVIRSLGAGGMAAVLLCEDERLGRRVAVKRLHAESPADTARRFVREAKLGAALSHPNLVTVLDTVTDEEGVLIVMEYVPGESLAAALRLGPLGAGRTLSVVRDVASALDHVHSHGVVHRDVKPGNVLLREDGTAKLVDLGIATAVDSTRITRTGVVMGTAPYLAPEQLDGGDVGPPGDVYALAAVAFEAFGGRKARPGRSPLEVAHRMAREPAPDLREAWLDAPAPLAEALKRGMARDPAERPPSAGALADEIDAAVRGDSTSRTRRLAPRPILEDEPLRTAPPARRPALTPVARRRHGPALAVAALAAVLLAVGAIALLSGGEDGRESAEAGGESAERQPARGQPESANREAPAPPTEQPSSPAEQPTGSSGGGPASGASLNQQGFELMNQGRYDEAIPVLQRAVNAFPAGTADLDYVYALFNLGRSLRLAGRPAEAIPILERRSRIPNQTDVVKRELKAARKEAKKRR